MFCLTLILCFNLRLYCASPLAATFDEAPPELRLQLNGNRDALESGAPEDMQDLFPEGYYFCYVFHGLTWVELALRDAAYKEQAISEALWCLDKLESADGRAPFPPHLPPDHGMFYSAWKASLFAGVVSLQGPGNETQVAKFREECDRIAAALRDSPTPFLQSYAGAVWPCDSLPAIHALAVYDRVLKENRFADVIDNWLTQARQRVDPETGLLPHTAGLPDGHENGVARATSQMIILRFLPDIDSTFARQQYESFRGRFLTTALGAPCLLEYPSGIEGRGDIDSGPLIFGRSLSGTVAMIGVAQIYNDQQVANAIAQAGETVGLPWTTDNKKRYVGGVLPVGEIIVAWAHVARPWFSRDHFPETSQRVSPFWRFPVHCVSLIILLPLIRRRSKYAPAHK